MVNYILFETAFGYALFEVLETEEIGSKLEEVQKATEDLVKFGKLVKLKSFSPFRNAVHALENTNDISEGRNYDGIIDKSLAGSIKTELGYNCETGELVLELIRGIRLHADKLLSQVKGGELHKAQLGLGHSYSRAKVKFNVNRADNMIIQAISLLDQLDKDINTFAMRVREWYSWHFPELVKIVNDNYLYAKLAKFIRNKSDLTEDRLEDLLPIVNDEDKARQIIDAAHSSMGTDIAELDMVNICHFADCIIDLVEYRKHLSEYLLDRMNNVAPNLSALIGEVVGARLISHAGSLTNLSKYPASTVQILGAEKALFR
ncbi:7054_t:CDS:2 [Entrophospora sp. SA101]|nr:7054_t:CDS:2 [Entrophospora sp. SA101]